MRQRQRAVAIMRFARQRWEAMSSSVAGAEIATRARNDDALRPAHQMQTTCALARNLDTPSIRRAKTY